MLWQEMVNHHGQEAGNGFDSSKNKWIIGSGSLLCQGLRRRREETAWKRRRINTSLVVVMLLLRMMTYFVVYKLFWNWIGVVRFVLHEVGSDEELTLSALMFSTNSVVVITQFLNSTYFQYQWIGKVKKTLKSNASQTSFLYVKKALQARFFDWKLRRRQKLSKKMRRRHNFLDWMGTLSCWCSMCIIIHKSPSPPHWTWSAEIHFQNFHIFNNILKQHQSILSLANFWGGALSKSMQIPKKRIETVGNHMQTVRTWKNHF